jgi:hypothetical protein
MSRTEEGTWGDCLFLKQQKIYLGCQGRMEGCKREKRGFALSMEGVHACEVIEERSLYDVRAGV